MARKYLGSGVTNSDGVASFNYTGKGLGKIQVVAESGELVSTSYDLYDVLFKDMGTSTDYSNWNPSFQIDGATTRTSTETTLQQIDPSVFGARTVNTNGATVIEFDINVNVSITFPSLRQGTSSVTNLSTQYLGISLDEWHHIKIEVDGVNYRAIVDGVAREWREMVGVQTYDRFQFSFNQDTGLVLKYKNFIMY